MTKAYRIHQILGEQTDATIYTTGGTYHMVKLEDVETGLHTKKVFYNKQKAFKYAEANAR